MNFLEIGNFQRPSLAHQSSQRHQIFKYARQIGALEDCLVLPRSLCIIGGDIAC